MEEEAKENEYVSELIKEYAMKDKQEEIREGIKHILEDKDAHFVSNWVVIDNIFNYLHSQGVVIGVDRELPDNPTEVTPYLGLTVAEAREKNLENNCFVKVIQAHMLKAGYVAVEPLVKEEHPIVTQLKSGFSGIIQSV